MGNGYTKLFADIVDSSIWEEPPETCKVWVTLLVLSDADGFVRGSVGWLAGKARVSTEKCQKAIDLFQQPDDRSRTPEHEGRRIELVPDGFLILNYLAFRDRLSNDPIAVATRERVKQHRERYKALRNRKSVTSGHSASASASEVASEGERGCKGKTDALNKCSTLVENGTLAQLVKAVAEFGIDEMTAANELRAGKHDMPALRKAVREFIADEANAVEPSKFPSARLRGYIRNMNRPNPNKPKPRNMI